LHSTHASFSFQISTATDLYPLSLHDALPISVEIALPGFGDAPPGEGFCVFRIKRDGLREVRNRAVEVTFLRFRDSAAIVSDRVRSEEHTSELQSRVDLVCRLLLEKKNKDQFK